jgi:hypothetical protein
MSALSSAVAAVPAGSSPTAAETAALRDGLRTAAALGVRGAYPVPGAGMDEGGVAVTVLAQAASVVIELANRQSAATAAHLPATPPPTDAARVTAAITIAGAVFGGDFVVVPGCTPPPAATMAAALAAAPALIGDPHSPLQWVQQAARVRDPLGRWRSVRLLAGASGAPAPVFDVVQLPVTAGARWSALPFASAADREPGRLSLVLDRVATPAATAVWYGLVVDEWVELIPNVTESTGLTFRYDDPGAEAAQAVLLAVPPVAGARSWDIDWLIATLNETLDLAKCRAVDARLLGALGQLLPAIYFAANNNDDTITMRWETAIRSEVTIAAAREVPA